MSLALRMGSVMVNIAARVKLGLNVKDASDLTAAWDL